MKTLAREHWARYGIRDEIEEEEARALMVSGLRLTPEIAKDMMRIPPALIGPLACVCIEGMAA